MFAWLKSLFVSMDRQTVASERAAQAAEDIAEMMESVRDQLRTRLCVGAPDPAPALPPAPVTPDPEPAEPARGKKGREK